LWLVLLVLLVLVTRVEISLGKLGACAHSPITEISRFYPNYKKMEEVFGAKAKVRPDDKGVTGLYAELWRFSE